MISSSAVAAAAATILSLALPVRAVNPVCIVGAGPAGLTAATTIESYGKTTVTFDKQALVGGKCQAAYEANGQYHPLGALIYTNATYTSTLPIINNSGVSSVPFDFGTFWDYNYQTGTSEAEPVPNAAESTLLAAEIARYTAYWDVSFYPYSKTPGYKNGVPSDFTKTTEAWLTEHGYIALKVVFIDAMTAYGYGDYREVPALYMLQYITPDILLVFAQERPGYLIDFHAVMVSYSKGIKGPINLGTTITNIDRSGASPVISYTASGSSTVQTQTCSSVIIAFAPTTNNLAAAHLELTSAEATVFGAVSTINYYSGAVTLSETPYGLSYRVPSPTSDVPPDASGEPVAFVKLFASSSVATSWSWAAASLTAYTGAQAEDQLLATLSKLNYNPQTHPNDTAGAVPVTSADVLGFQDNSASYFPHFAGAQLAAGYYAKFDALQGANHTYYASGLNMFETVEFAVRAGLDIASYFK